MFYSILMVAAVAAMLYFNKRWKSLPPEQRADFAMKAGLWGAAVTVVVLVLAGRAHWLMGVLAALIALASRAMQLAQFVPMFKKAFDQTAEDGANTGKANNSAAVNSNTMTRSDAADILGVSSKASAEEVRSAHKKLMQKIHPDRGGTDALAAQINEAKKTLLS